MSRRWPETAISDRGVMAETLAPFAEPGMIPAARPEAATRHGWPEQIQVPLPARKAHLFTETLLLSTEAQK